MVGVDENLISVISIILCYDSWNHSSLSHIKSLLFLCSVMSIEKCAFFLTLLYVIRLTIGSWARWQVMSMLVDGQQTLVTDNRPTLLVLNKKDLIKPGEIATKKEVPHLGHY